MREKTTYIAYDNTVFDDMGDCERYELKKSDERTMIFLDENSKEIKISDYDNVNVFLGKEDYVYVKVKTQEDIDYLNSIDHDNALPHDTGEFYWDEDYACWGDINDKIMCLKTELKQLEYAKETLYLLSCKDPYLEKLRKSTTGEEDEK